MSSNHEHQESEEYGDTGIRSNDAPIPNWLKWNYIFWIIVGLVGFYLFWNGSNGWLDRGYWEQLQRAAGTTFPFQDEEAVPPASTSKHQGGKS